MDWVVILSTDLLPYAHLAPTTVGVVGLGYESQKVGMESLSQLGKV